MLQQKPVWTALGPDGYGWTLTAGKAITHRQTYLTAVHCLIYHTCCDLESRLKLTMLHRGSTLPDIPDRDLVCRELHRCMRYDVSRVLALIGDLGG